MVRSQEEVRPVLLSAREGSAIVPVSLSKEPGVRRIHSIRMNSDVFSGAAILGSTVDVLPNVPVRVSWTKSERLDKEGTLLWTGTVEGAPWGAATLVAKGSVVTGAITRGDGVAHQIRTAEDGSGYSVMLPGIALFFRLHGDPWPARSSRSRRRVEGDRRKLRLSWRALHDGSSMYRAYMRR